MRRLQPATLEDLNDLSSLVNSAYRGDSSREGWTTEADFLKGQRTDSETLRQTLKDGSILCLRENQELIGCVFIEHVSPKASCYLGMLTIKPTLQAAGLGRELLQGAEDYARQAGAKKMILGVVQVRESLIAWYKRRGYVANGETEAFPYGDERFGIPQRPDLHFIFLEKPL